MKSKLSFLPVLAILSGLALSSYTSGTFQQNDASLTNYTWVRLSDNATITDTQPNAQAALECPSLNQTPCAQAYEEGHAGEEGFRVETMDITKPQP